jgi:HAMP domain-containing protein
MRALARQRIEAQEEQVQANEERIAEARERVDRREQAGEISADEARNMRDRLSRAEGKVGEMRRVVERQKREVDALERALEKSTEE